MKYIYNIEKTKDYTEKIDFEEKSELARIINIRLNS